MAQFPRSSPVPPEQPGGILAQLRADHAQVRAMFHLFALLDRDDESERARVVDELCEALLLHALLEDELFYPALRRVVDQRLLDDAALEHDSMRDLVEQLESLFPEDDCFTVTVAVLAEEMEGHIAFEESTLFPAFARSGIDQLSLGMQMRARRAQLELDLSAPPAIDGCDPRGVLRSLGGRQRERRSRPR